VVLSSLETTTYRLEKGIFALFFEGGNKLKIIVMQGKGIIKTLLFILIVICVVQFLYILPTRNVEKKADAFAEQVASSTNNPDEVFALKKSARAQYLDSMSSENILSIPGLKSYTYDELKKQQLNLGLDLAGGMSATLRIDLKELLVALSNNTKDPTFLQALEDADKALTSSQSDYITLFGDAFRNIAGDKKLTKFFYRNLSEELNTQSTDGEVIRVLRQQSNEVVDLTFKLLKQRIDKLGVTQPNVSLDAQRDLILVEMPGIQNKARAENVLQSSASLEFWDVYRVSDAGVLGAFAQADQLAKQSESEEVIEDVIQMDTTYTPVLDSLGNETGESTMQITERALDPFANQGPLFSMLSLNSGGLRAGSVMGMADKNKKNAVDKILQRPDIKRLFPRDSDFRWAASPAQDYATRATLKQYELYMIKKKPGSDKAPLEGDRVTSASQSPDETGEIAVSLNMDVQGAKIWADMTTKAAQDNQRPVAIVLDDEVVSAPSVNVPITGGRSSITGNFSVEEASDLANMLEIGKLPAKVKIIQSANVGPTLGAENIRRSFTSLLIGMALLLIFMLVYYGGAGLVAIIALLANIFFIFGALASFGTVLTLPGFAGVILTIGMAVDANVIIFERVREELRAGKSLLAAVADGFKHSYSAIIDANVTTLLIMAVLFYFGIGPIKGFATILIVGVLSSLFTAVLLGRMMIEYQTISRGKEITFWTGFSKNAFADLKVDWLGKRKLTYIFSGVLIFAGLVSMFTRGFDLGVDFKGGYSYDVQFDQDVNQSAQELSTALTETFGVSTQVKAVDTENTFNVVTSYLINKEGEDVEDEVIAKLHEGLTGVTGISTPLEKFKALDAINATHITRSNKVGPTIADDIFWSSLKAGIFALLVIFLYIFLRFNKWQFSLGAVGALFHDTLIVLGLFSLLRGFFPISLEIDQNFIAAILTVIGYSINDTVVVFDRIREYLGIYTQKSKDEVINMAVNSTVSRTVVTSLTTLFVVGILLVFGGSSTRGFAFALFLGIVVGTYSSIFVATPIVRDLTGDLKSSIKRKVENKSFSRAAEANS